MPIKEHGKEAPLHGHQHIYKFYGMSEWLLDKIRELLKKIKGNEVTLWLPTQILNEFYRNRGDRIGDKLDDIKSSKLDLPSLADFQEDFEEIEGVNDDLDKIWNSLREKTQKEELMADKIIKELFNEAEEIDSDDFKDGTRDRREWGNPPDDREDALVWESLLRGGPEEGTFYFVSDNTKHFGSEVEESRLAQFLAREWKKENNSEIIFYQNIGDFLRKIGVKGSEEVSEKEEELEKVEEKMEPEELIEAFKGLAWLGSLTINKEREAEKIMEEFAESIGKSIAPISTYSVDEYMETAGEEKEKK